ncbi:ufm1-specific protease 2 [Galendromus occidentalis]|uniref:Probable Ufm1-specific protease 2 n=1 Tax=Galendromus occidentalis TaxID=34638 RepID=A0AAJ6VVX3_9ACAR|nr:ufm1-specific protease 2 [Galendromus occidentalis]
MVGQKVVVCKNLWQRLEATTDVFRSLFGFVDGNGTLHITGTTLQRHPLPHGQPALGIYCSKDFDTESILSQCQRRVLAIQEALDILEAPNFVLLSKEQDTPRASLIGTDGSTESRADVVLSDFAEIGGVLLRARLSIPLSVEYCGAEGRFRETLSQAIGTNCSWLTPGNVTFDLRGELTKINPDLEIGDFIKKALQRKSEPEGTDILELLPVRIMGSGDISARGDAFHSPVIHIQRGNAKVFDFPLILDVVSFFPYDTKVRTVSELLTKALQQQTSTSVEVICSSISENQLTPPAPMHFKVDNGFATILYPRNQVNNVIKFATRTDLAMRGEKPTFSSGQALFFTQDSNLYSGLLVNPHNKLKPPAKATRTAIVQGEYLYYHYMQQKFDDCGWGCAYRSLQTLCSWFRLQGFTEEDVPNHEKIQRTLVEIGDKQANFIGSRQWIGSQEVSFVLNQLTKVDSKTIYVSSGAELATKANDLIDHFTEHGTPVMIGGGQLAHTILGVAVNDASEEVHFLILDPHYTGSEDLQTINGKGWCNWKPQTFWDKNSFYNMCLPQVPKRVEQ